MTTDKIIEVGIDEKGRLYIKPQTQHFEFIYRAAAEVNWDNKEMFLYSPKPREWSYYAWYKHIITIANDEYGCKLQLTDKTKWINIPTELKQQIIER